MTRQTPDALEKAIAEARADPAKQAAAELAILSAEIYVAPSEGTPPPGVVLGRDRPLKLMGIVLSDGVEAAAGFSQAAFAQPVLGTAASMAMRGQHFLEAFRDGVIVLNPGREEGLVLTRRDIAAILDGAGEASPLTDSADVELTTPDPEPTVLVARLRSSLTGEGVHGAWLARSKDLRSGELGWRLEVRGDASLKTVRDRVRSAIEGLGFGGEALDLVMSSGQGADGEGLRLI